MILAALLAAFLVLIYNLHSKPSPRIESVNLIQVGEWNRGFTYQFNDLSSCSLSDGSVAFSVQGRGQARILSASFETPNEKLLKTSYDVIRFVKGSTTGEIAMSKELEVMARGESLKKIRGEFHLNASSRYWYFIVIHASVKAPILQPWEIHGVKVTYASHGAIKSVSVKQTISLPSAPNCQVG